MNPALESEESVVGQTAGHHIYALVALEKANRNDSVRREEDRANSSDEIIRKDDIVLE